MVAADDTSTTRLSRRNFLSAAALGAAYVAAGPAASLASADPQPVSTENLDAFEGELLAFSKGTFEVETDGSVRQVVALGGSTFWKGGETSWDGFSVGDTVLVRTVNGQLDRAWANLIQRTGFVLSGSSDVVTIALDDNGTDRLAVSLPSSTDFRDAFTGQATRVTLPPTTSVNVVGLETPDGLVASAIRYGLPGAAPQTTTPTQPSVTVSRAVSASPDVQMCTYTYNHFASLFACPPSACGTCSTSNSSQCAWPAQDVCNCCNGVNGCACDCVHGCLTLAIAGCGHHVQVTDACNGKYRDTVIVDCGPCMSNCGCPTNVCGHVCNYCGLSRTHPIVDLTKPTFSIFYDPSKVMCFPAKVAVTIPC